MNNPHLKDLLNILSNNYDQFMKKEPVDLLRYKKASFLDHDVSHAFFNDGEHHWRLSRVYGSIKIAGIRYPNKEPFEMAINLDLSGLFVHFAARYKMGNEPYTAIAQDTFKTKNELLVLVEKHMTQPFEVK